MNVLDHRQPQVQGLGIHPKRRDRDQIVKQQQIRALARYLFAEALACHRVIPQQGRLL
jgi:hypothetical protein